MSEMEDKLGAILNNPQMMQQIMSIAQMMQSSPAAGNPPPKQEQSEPDTSGFDPQMLQRIAGFASANRTDPNQQALLTALSPYLSRDRVEKLERAMRAARLAGIASTFLSSGGLRMLAGR